MFFEHRIKKILSTKLTYTVDSYSFSNIGIGLSTQLGPINAYFITDNLLNFNNLYDAKSMSFQAGINLIFNKNN